MWRAETSLGVCRWQFIFSTLNSQADIEVDQLAPGQKFGLEHDLLTDIYGRLDKASEAYTNIFYDRRISIWNLEMHSGAPQFFSQILENSCNAHRKAIHQLKAVLISAVRHVTFSWGSRIDW
jgi:hypothetical protein